jgi:hypothetical protein
MISEAQPAEALAALLSGPALIFALGVVIEGCAGQPAMPDPHGGCAVTVNVYGPTGQSPAQSTWQAYPAPPPPGFHWQHTGSPAIQVDPEGRPLPGQSTGTWVLVRDGYRMPTMR